MTLTKLKLQLKQIPGAITVRHFYCYCVSVHFKVTLFVYKMLTDLKREGLMSQFEQSLKSLQVPYLDMFYLHAPDHDTPIEETLTVVQELYKGGL